MRNVRWTLVAAICALLLSSAPAAMASPVACGDCDGNGSVDILDSLLAGRISSGLVIPTPVQQAVCDVDNDGGIDAVDSLLMAQAAAGLPVTLTCPPCPPQIDITGFGYCVIGNLNTGNNWQIAVSDSDPITGASFTTPPLFPGEIQLATVINPAPFTDPTSASAAFVAAVNATQPFADAAAGMGHMAGFAAVATPGVPPSGGLFDCFTTVVASTSTTATHNAAIGIVNPADGTICFPPPGAGSCLFNPTLVAVDLDLDENGNGIPDGVEEYLPPPDGDGSGNNGGGDNGDGGADNGDGGSDNGGDNGDGGSDNGDGSTDGDRADGSTGDGG